MATRYFILVRRKNAKKYFGAFPTKPGSTKTQIQKAARQQLSKQLSYRIVTATELANYTKQLLIKKRRSNKRKLKRKR